MLSIKIYGQVGEGKTTLALSLERWLQIEGFANVIVQDADINLGTSYPELQDQRREAIKDTPIVIETIQLMRTHKVENDPSRGV
jgi:CO dehydrogenase nickel-insertion accessory protein CooC1